MKKYEAQQDISLLVKNEPFDVCNASYSNPDGHDKKLVASGYNLSRLNVHAAEFVPGQQYTVVHKKYEDIAKRTVIKSISGGADSLSSGTLPVRTLSRKCYKDDKSLSVAKSSNSVGFSIKKEEGQLEGALPEQTTSNTNIFDATKQVSDGENKGAKSFTTSCCGSVESWQPKSSVRILSRSVSDKTRNKKIRAVGMPTIYTEVDEKLLKEKYTAIHKLTRTHRFPESEKTFRDTINNMNVDNAKLSTRIKFYTGLVTAMLRQKNKRKASEALAILFKNIYFLGVDQLTNSKFIVDNNCLKLYRIIGELWLRTGEYSLCKQILFYVANKHVYDHYLGIEYKSYEDFLVIPCESCKVDNLVVALLEECGEFEKAKQRLFMMVNKYTKRHDLTHYKKSCLAKQPSEVCRSWSTNNSIFWVLTRTKQFDDAKEFLINLMNIHRTGSKLNEEQGGLTTICELFAANIMVVRLLRMTSKIKEGLEFAYKLRKTSPPPQMPPMVDVSNDLTGSRAYDALDYEILDLLIDDGNYIDAKKIILELFNKRRQFQESHFLEWNSGMFKSSRDLETDIKMVKLLIRMGDDNYSKFIEDAKKRHGDDHIFMVSLLNKMNDDSCMDVFLKVADGLVESEYNDSNILIAVSTYYLIEGDSYKPCHDEWKKKSYNCALDYANRACSMDAGNGFAVRQVVLCKKALGFPEEDCINLLEYPDITIISNPFINKA